MKATNLAIALGFSVLVGTASTPYAASPATSPTIDPKRITEHVRVLSSDAFEGRGPASAAEAKTVDYIVAQLNAAGLKPGGDVQKSGRA